MSIFTVPMNFSLQTKTKNVAHVKRSLTLNGSQMTVVFLPDSLSLIYPIALLQQNRSDPKAV